MTGRVYTAAFAVCLALALLLPGSDVWAFRCGVKLITEGDATEEVRAACGEPANIFYRAVPRSHYTECPYFGPGESPRYSRYDRKSCTIFERWVYDPGTSRLTRHLFFKNGVLERIETGDYGY